MCLFRVWALNLSRSRGGLAGLPDLPPLLFPPADTSRVLAGQVTSLRLLRAFGQPEHFGAAFLVLWRCSWLLALQVWKDHWASIIPTCFKRDHGTPDFKNMNLSLWVWMHNWQTAVMPGEARWYWGPPVQAMGRTRVRILTWLVWSEACWSALLAILVLGILCVAGNQADISVLFFTEP